MLTVIIPTYRRPSLLQRALLSVISDKDSDIQVHVCDNHSEDGTKEIVANFQEKDKRIFYFENKENIGARANGLLGLSRVDTEQYMVLSDDDFLLPGFLKEAIKTFREHPDVRFVCAPTIHLSLIDKTFSMGCLDWSSGLHPAGVQSARRMHHSHFPTTSVVFHEEVKSRLGEFESGGSDALYMTLAAGRFPFYVLNKPGGVFVAHAGSYTASGSWAREDSMFLYRTMAQTMGLVNALDVPDELKGELSLLVADTYNKIFDSIRVFGYINYEEIKNPLAFSTSSIGAVGVLTRRFPAKIRKSLLQLILFAKKVAEDKALSKNKRNLSENALDSLSGGAMDMADFKALVDSLHLDETRK
ncbi:glycosyltransferase family A protein [Castellaniella sp.]|uniref:glycosyltransferase family A protein n=1 Tax=Castellaniella sp. TaxID=1955812 RepID=UPI003C78EA39